MNPEIKPEDNKHNVSVKNKPCQFYVFAGTKEKLEKINKKKGVTK